MSDIILSKNVHKINFLKNWRQIYKKLFNKNNFPFLFKKRHKLTLKEQARIYFNQKIGTNFAEVIKEYRKQKKNKLLAPSKHTKEEEVDRKPFNIKEFELQHLK